MLGAGGGVGGHSVLVSVLVLVVGGGGGGGGDTGGFHVEDVVHGSASGDEYFCETECDCEGGTAYDAELHSGAE